MCGPNQIISLGGILTSIFVWGGPWACQNAHLEQDGLTSVWDTFLSRRQEYGCDIDCLAIQEEFICVFLNFHNFKRLHYYIDYDYNTIIFSLLQNI